MNGEIIQKKKNLSNNKFSTILKQKENNEENFQSLLFVGNRHETVPVRLLADKYLTARAKTAWQLIKLNSMQFRGTLFPSYDELAIWLSDKAYQNKPLSRKLISQTLLLLRLTRWLTLCETVRDEKGQILGNVYIMNDEPLSISDSITLNEDYLQLLEKTTKHKDPVLKQVSEAIIDEILNTEQLTHFVSHIEVIQERYKQQCQLTIKNGKLMTQLPNNLQKAVTKTQQKLQSSHLELGQKQLSSNMEPSLKNRELCNNTQSSNMELSPEKIAKSLILGLVPNGNSDTKYSTSTLNKIQYCTNTETISNQLDQFPLSQLEKQSILKMMANLSDETCNAVIFEAASRIGAGDIKKPAGYLFNLVKRAINGEFKPYLINKTQTQMKAVSKSEKLTVTSSNPFFTDDIQISSGNEKIDLTNIIALAKSRN